MRAPFIEYILLETSYPPVNPQRDTPGKLAARERWIAAVPGATEDVGRDHEEFYEDVALYDACVPLLTSSVAVKSRSKPDRRLAVVGRYGSPYHCDSWGDFAGYLWPDERSLEAAARWAENPILRPFLRREMAIADGFGEPGEMEQPIDQVLARMCAERDRELMVKVRLPKYMAPQRLRFGQGWSAAACASEVCRVFEFVAVNLEGRKRIFEISDWILMRSEYRIAMVGYRPVAGAGCIESMTPYDAFDPPVAFDPRVELRRNRSAVQARPNVVKSFVKTATAIGQRLEAAGSPLRNFVLDLCRTGGGRDAIVECNPMLNFGFYAMDVNRFIAAVKTEIETRAHAAR